MKKIYPLILSLLSLFFISAKNDNLNDITNMIWIIISILVMVFIVIAAIIGFINLSNETIEEEKLRKKREERLRREQEAEKERLRKEKEAEEERLRREQEEFEKGLCVICDQACGDSLECEDCNNRIVSLMNEKSFQKLECEELIKKYKTTLYKLAHCKENEERYFLSSLLIATFRTLKYNYNIDYEEKMQSFLYDFKDLNYKVNNDFLIKYDLKTAPAAEEASDEPGRKFDQFKLFHCNDEHTVRSKSEREIDNFLFANRIWHIYEYSYQHPVTQEMAKPDFYLPDYNLIIEYFGLNTPEYLENREHKIKMYRSDSSIKFEYLTFEDDHDLAGKLREICGRYNIPLK